MFLICVQVWFDWLYQYMIWYDYFAAVQNVISLVFYFFQGNHEKEGLMFCNMWLALLNVMIYQVVHMKCSSIEATIYIHTARNTGPLWLMQILWIAFNFFHLHIIQVSGNIISCFLYPVISWYTYMYGYVWDNDRGKRHSWNQNRRGRRPRRFRFTDDVFRGHYAT